MHVVQSDLVDYDEVAVHAVQIEELCELVVQWAHGDVEEDQLELPLFLFSQQLLPLLGLVDVGGACEQQVLGPCGAVDVRHRSWLVEHVWELPHEWQGELRCAVGDG